MDNAIFKRALEEHANKLLSKYGKLFELKQKKCCSCY
mgnify:CR=1 FL=1